MGFVGILQFLRFVLLLGIQYELCTFCPNSHLFIRKFAIEKPLRVLIFNSINI